MKILILSNLIFTIVSVSAKITINLKKKNLRDLYDDTDSDNLNYPPQFGVRNDGSIVINDYQNAQVMSLKMIMH